MIPPVASFAVKRPDLFPESTVIKAYPANAWHEGQPGAPSGPATAEATVSSGEAIFTGLSAGSSYVLYASVSSKDVYLDYRADQSFSLQSIAARVAEAPSGGTELGIAIFGAPMTLVSFYLVVEANEVELHLNHRAAEVPGTKVKVKAAEATEAAPKLTTVNFSPASWGELVAIVKGVGGSPFINLTAVFQ